MVLRGSRVPLLVLANLGLLPFAACKQEEVVEPAMIPPATSTPTSTPTSTSTSTPTSTPISTPTASASAATDECVTDNDCGAPYKECVMVAGTAGGKGRCAYRKNYHLGRPLVVDGAVHVAPFVRPPLVSSAEVAALLESAREEHASVAAFARTIAELMALGAPTSLLFETQAALADEIRHTELTLDVIERSTGARPTLGRLEAAVAPLRSGPDAAAKLFRDVFRGGAIGETLAAARAEHQRELTREPALRSFYDTLVNDEARHAALAWKTLRWLLDTRPELAAVRDEEKARLAGSGTSEERLLTAPLLAVLD